MKNIILKNSVFLFCILFPAATLFSQNVIIDYAAWNPSSPPCNVFAAATNVPAVINGVAGTIQHQTQIGQPTYNTSGKFIQLECKYVNASSTLGTKYRIAYNFKVGYTYTITANAAELINTAGSSTGPYLRFDLTNYAGNGGTCTGPANISTNVSGNPAAQQLNSTTFYDYSFAFSTALTATASSLEVSAVPAINTSNYIAIKKITIVETAPAAPELVLSPTSLSATCGTTTSKTFTVSNPNNVTGITGYNWNFGVTPNGWLFNNIAAPATYSGTANSISLTSICGSIPKSISVNVMKGSTVYKTYTSTVSNTQQTYTITGNDPLCTSTGQYTVSPALCNATYNWVSSNTNIATVTASGNPATVTKVGNGGTTLTATISNGCTGGNLTVTKSIKVGSTSSNFTVSGPSSSCYNTTQYYSTNAPVGNITWSWPSDWSYQSGQNSTLLTVRTGNSSGSVSVSVPNGCTGSSTASTYTQINSSNCGFGLIATPNPTTDNVTVSVADQKSVSSVRTKKAMLYQVKVIDQFGNVKKQYKYSSGASNTSISLRELISGIYTIQAFDGTSWSSVKVIKQ